MRTLRILYVISQPVRWAIFENLYREHEKSHFDPSFVILSQASPALLGSLQRAGAQAEHLRYGGKHHLPFVVPRLRRLCLDRRIDVVHAHFMDACLVGLIAARLAGVRVRVHTRHHAGPYPADHREPWGLFLDRLNNAASTHIIAPSDQARQALLLTDGVPEDKTRVVRHGFDLDDFRAPSPERVAGVRTRWGIPDGGPVVGVVARYERIKGVHTVVSAFERLLERFPNAVLVLANARGRNAPGIHALLGRLPPDRYAEIPFEEDNAALYKLFDVLVHVPLRPDFEGFGMPYVEALASGTPSIVAPAGVGCEILEHQRNAWVVASENCEAICEGLIAVLTDRRLRSTLIEHGFRTARSFGIGPMVRSLEALYVEAVTAATPAHAGA